jgi:amidase
MIDRFPRRLVSGLAGGLALLVLQVSPASAATFDLQTATIEDINKAFDAGVLTSEKLVQLYLNRIAAYDKKGPNINAVITLQPKALELARALDQERKQKGPRSKLHGVPVVLKDLFDTKDMPTSAGFMPMKNSQPIHDATVVARSPVIRARCSAALPTRTTSISRRGARVAGPAPRSRRRSDKSGWAARRVYPSATPRPTTAWSAWRPPAG